RQDGRLEEWKPGALRFAHELGRRREAARDQHAREIVRERQAQRAGARCRLEALEVADLALAENQDTPGPQILVEPGEREAGLLDVRAGDDAVEAPAAGEQIERQAERLGTAPEQRADGNARDWRHASR